MSEVRVAEICKPQVEIEASPRVKGVNAGLSFDLVRHFNPIELSRENQLLTERLNEVLAALTELRHDAQFPSHAGGLENIHSAILHVRNSLRVTDLGQDQ